jgi:hypothetical protein
MERWLKKVLNTLLLETNLRREVHVNIKKILTKTRNVKKIPVDTKARVDKHPIRYYIEL